MNPAFLRLWGWPLLLALLTVSGLASALFSDSWGDAWSWLALGGPLAVLAWCWTRPRRRPAQPRAG